MKVIITDLDRLSIGVCSRAPVGWELAFDAVRRLRVPLVLWTEKTLAEAEVLLRSVDVDAPFVVENGGAVYMPSGHFFRSVAGSVRRSRYEVVEFGERRSNLVHSLKTAARESGCEVFGFREMTAAEIRTRAGLPATEVEAAQQREYDEPFLAPAHSVNGLLRRIEAHGKTWTRERVFYRIRGRNDAAGAVRLLCENYRSCFGDIATIGLGDSSDDLAFLSHVDTPILVRSTSSSALRRALPHCRVSRYPGRCGWNQAVLEEIGLPATRLGRQRPQADRTCSGM